MTPDEAGFFRTILDHPDDDAPRLIYADWLEDRGETDRAEFIRVQCELAALKRNDERRLELKVREAVLQPSYESSLRQLNDFFADQLIDWQFNRGMPCLPLNVSQFRQLLWNPSATAAYFEIALHVSDIDKVEALSRHPLLHRVVALKCYAGIFDIRNTKQAVQTRLILGQMRLRELCFDGCVFIAPEAAELYHHWSEFDWVTRLSFARCRLTDVDVALLVSSSRPNDLISLDLHDNSLTDQTLVALATATALPRLRWLGLVGSQHQFSEQALANLANSSALPALETICFGHHDKPTEQCKARYLEGHFGPIALVPENVANWYR